MTGDITLPNRTRIEQSFLTRGGEPCVRGGLRVELNVAVGPGEIANFHCWLPERYDAPTESS